MHWRIFIFVIILISLTGQNKVCARGPDVEVRYRNFTIIYPPADEKRALMALNVLKRYNKKMADFYGIQLQGQISVYLPSTRQQFRRLIGGRLPSWSGAVYISGRRMIVLKNPRWMTGDARIDRDLPHELSHVYFDSKFGARKLPLWFNEGLAEYLSGEEMTIQNGVTISNALLANKIMPLADIDSLLLFSASRARLAYLQSFTVIRYLHHQYLKNTAGWNSFLNLIDAAGFQPAVEEITGRDIIDFEIEWYRWLEDKYRWFVVFNFENLIWVGMVIVLAGALYAIRYRNRKILARWEREESGYDDYYTTTSSYTYFTGHYQSESEDD